MTFNDGSDISGDPVVYAGGADSVLEDRVVLIHSPHGFLCYISPHHLLSVHISQKYQWSLFYF